MRTMEAKDLKAAVERSWDGMQSLTKRIKSTDTASAEAFADFVRLASVCPRDLEEAIRGNVGRVQASQYAFLLLAAAEKYLNASREARIEKVVA